MVSGVGSIPVVHSGGGGGLSLELFVCMMGRAGDCLQLLNTFHLHPALINTLTTDISLISGVVRKNISNLKTIICKSLWDSRDSELRLCLVSDMLSLFTTICHNVMMSGCHRSLAGGQQSATCQVWTANIVNIALQPLLGDFSVISPVCLSPHYSPVGVGRNHPSLPYLPPIIIIITEEFFFGIIKWLNLTVNLDKDRNFAANNNP